MSKTVQNLSRLVVIEHSIFALPFVFASFLMAYRQGPLIQTHAIFVLVLLMVCCAVTARSAAMGFNRLVDLEFDKANPRTANRELVTGEVSKFSVSLLVLVSGSGFIFCSYLIGPHCAILAPWVLVFLFFYSLTKRFTAISHLVLGIALGLAPGGAWWILRPQVEAVPLILIAAVSFWVAGFDTIYACQDLDFDRSNKLHSIPAMLGIRSALRVAKFFHALSIVLLMLVGVKLDFGATYFLGMLPIAMMFNHQHLLVREDDLSKLNRAFFTVNGWVALYYLLLVAVLSY